MKKILVMCLSILPLSQSWAFTYGYSKPFYIGLEAGGGNLHYEQFGLREGARSVKDDGFAGRLLAGFDANQNVGVEFGYTRYQDTEYHFPHDLAQNSQQSVDFLTKLSLPVS